MDTGLLPVTSANWDRSEFHVQYHLIDFANAMHFKAPQPVGQDAKSNGSPVEKECQEFNRLASIDVLELGSSLRQIFQEVSSYVGHSIIPMLNVPL